MIRYYSDDERRREARMYRSGEIFVELVAPTPDETSSPEIVRCEVLDISATGAQLLADDSMKVGAIHTLVIDLDEYDKNYRLAGEVRWVRTHNDGFLIGFEFLDSEQTGIDDWKGLLANFLN
ncbi:hypothetical protein A3715_06290 [Oleiphilus sp. HI0009]|uniref:PilZ domain-containing protein n=1 Tax=unclassified Oleiphilus TaxID=2631174 RepID=UPI0007C2A196|nr:MULTISPECIES: PilZ domain-containing protein [unclassified Oleiphilus]KZX82123.1 hypothetical protein A3715_06290 [Oleiphilus sp. HI0009]KZY66367.1 hypothetical protein A3738_06710 [Oleiphilus sp. HI0066]KZY71784.1 hypothetical protein A3739_03900 [Oleiphilus sp. HI0067]